MSRLGPYRLMAQLGRGGMADVHRAERPAELAAGGPTDCVLKVLRPDKRGSAELARMFEAEIRLMGRLRHPNIVTTYDGGVIDGLPYLAMELCQGANLHQLVKALGIEGQAFPPEVAVFVAHEIAQALAHVHALPDRRGRRLGLVHRDVSPSNIMLLDQGVVKLLDFGVAKATRLAPASSADDSEPRPEHTRVNTIKGKLRYMAPEQVLGRPLDGRSDLFALGVILWELLAGRPLFARETPQETGALIIGGPPPPPLRSMRPEISVALEAVVARTLEREPRHRFQSGLSLAAELATLMPPPLRASRALTGLMSDMARRLADVRTRSATPRTTTPVTPTTGSATTVTPRPVRRSAELSPVGRTPTPASRTPIGRTPPAGLPRPDGLVTPRPAWTEAVTAPPAPVPYAPPMLPPLGRLPEVQPQAMYELAAPAMPWTQRSPEGTTPVRPRGHGGGATSMLARVLWIVAAASVGFAGGAMWHRHQVGVAASLLPTVISTPAGVAIERLPRRHQDDHHSGPAPAPAAGRD